MKKIIKKFLLVFIFIFFMNLSQSFAFSNEKINNFMNNFYSKLNKINPKLEKQIEKLKLIKAKIKYARISKADFLSDDTKKALEVMENNLANKINIYKNMLWGSFEWLSDVSLNLYKKIKKMWISVRNCSAGQIVDKYTHKKVFEKKCAESIKNISEMLEDSNNRLKKAGTSLKNCVFWKIYYRFSKNDKYYKECLSEREKIKEVLTRELVWFNELSDKEKSSYVTKFFLQWLIFKKSGLRVGD